MILKVGALRNLTLFVKFLPLSFLLEIKCLPRLTNIELGEFSNFGKKPLLGFPSTDETNSHFVNCKFYTVPGRPVESVKKETSTSLTDSGS